MQICAIAVALLESGVDNEFLLAVNLLEKVGGRAVGPCLMYIGRKPYGVG